MARKSAPKSAQKKEVAIAATPIIERYRSRHTWNEFVMEYVPADKYPTMRAEYLKQRYNQLACLTQSNKAIALSTAIALFIARKKANYPIS